MALVVEDGTGVVGANSYASAEDADAYFADRANTTWSAADDVTKSAALINATDYIEMKGTLLWKGQEEFPDAPQGLSFPRVNMGYGLPDGLPTGVVRATYEYAVRWINSGGTGLVPDPAFDETGRLPTLTTERVGPIIETNQWDETKGSSFVLIRPYPFADAMLQPYMRSGGAGVIRN
jgi:hypothetical protein